MHPAAVRYDVIRALGSGAGRPAIERLTGVPPRSQRRIAREEVPFGMTDQELRARRNVGRPSRLSPAFREVIDRTPGQRAPDGSRRVLRRLRSDHGYQGGKSAVYDWVKAARPPRPAALPVVRFEGVAGEFAQHDFGTLTVTYQDGTAEKLTFYAGRLKYSRALYVSLAPAETAEAYHPGHGSGGRGLGRAAADQRGGQHQSGGPAPEAGRRRPGKSGSTTRSSSLPSCGRWTSSPSRPRPYAGNQKGSVESLVKFVKHGFFLARRFRHRDDLLRQLGEWLTRRQ